MGLRKDLSLTGNDYQWLASIFYFGSSTVLCLVLTDDLSGYLVWEYPSNRLMQRLPLAKYSAFCIIACGAVQCCFAAMNNFRSAAALRFLLGVFESAVAPGFALITSRVGLIQPFSLVSPIIIISGIRRKSRDLEYVSGSPSTALARF
jgi:MFS transporter, ACS family, allantoate permease